MQRQRKSLGLLEDMALELVHSPGISTGFLLVVEIQLLFNTMYARQTILLQLTQVIHKKCVALNGIAMGQHWQAEETKTSFAFGMLRCRQEEETVVSNELTMRAQESY